MVEKHAIDRLKIQGFKSLQDVDLELGKLNVLIGPNGAGKSNLVSYFQMLREMAEERLQVWIGKRGGADRLLTFGAKRTSQLSSRISIGDSYYEFMLEHTDDDRLVFGEETSTVIGDQHKMESWSPGGSLETDLITLESSKEEDTSVRNFYASICRAGVFHFHDTSETALVKLTGSLHDNRYLRPDASNLAAFLYMLKHFRANTYEQIRKTVSLALPFFDDFVLERQKINPDEYTIQLMWKQNDSDYPFLASQLSDGSLRFICLVTALLQPDAPSTIIIDEPELGLHPYAISLLGSLLSSASERMQVIVATQSPQLLDEFSVEDLIVVELRDGVSVFNRLKESDFNEWLKDFSVGELWDKNVLGGGLP